MEQPLLRDAPELVRRLAPQFRAQLRSALVADAELWEDAAGFEAALDAACEAPLERALDAGFAERVHARFGRGQPLEALASRLLTGAGDAHAVAELRFKGMDRSQPFVELGLLTPAALRAPEPFVRIALAAFAPFAPSRARVSVSAPDLARLEAAGLALEPDLLSVAAPLAKLLAAPPPARRLELRPIEDAAAAYGRYAALYADFAERCPHLAREVQRATPEQLALLVAHGKCFDAFAGASWAGIVAAAPERFWGQPGWVVHEQLLSAEFRGRGLGLALQRALVERLEGEPGLLWGTIHASNRPSLATALRHGRTIAQTHTWVWPLRG